MDSTRHLWEATGGYSWAVCAGSAGWVLVNLRARASLGSNQADREWNSPSVPFMGIARFGRALSRGADSSSARAVCVGGEAGTGAWARNCCCVTGEGDDEAAAAGAAVSSAC